MAKVERPAIRCGPLQCATLLCVVSAWTVVVRPDEAAVLRALLAAGCFSAIEFCFYKLTGEDPATGAVTWAPFGQPGHTTLHQFWANVMYTPVLLAQAASGGAGGGGGVSWLHVVLFPLWIWLLEIVEGYTLMLLFGHNPAWSYSGRRAFFHGNITLGHAPFWVGLGAAVHYGGYAVLTAAARWLAERVGARLPLAAAAATTLAARRGREGEGQWTAWMLAVLLVAVPPLL